MPQEDVQRIYREELEEQHSPRRPPPEFHPKYTNEAPARIIALAGRRFGPLGFVENKVPKAKGKDPWEPDGGGTPSEKVPDKTRSLHFDEEFKARTVRLSRDHTSCSWRGQDFGGFIISKQPLCKYGTDGRWFEIKIEDVETSRWSDALGIGVCVHPSGNPAVKVDKTTKAFEGPACELLPESWLLGYDGIAKLCGKSRYFQEAELPMGMWRPRELECGDIVGLFVTCDGHMMLFVNEQLRYFVPHCNVPWSKRLYAVVDLDGCTQAVHILNTNGFPSIKVQSKVLEYVPKQDQSIASN